MADIASLNLVVLVGRVGGEPKIMVSETKGTKISSFSLATNEIVSYRDGREPKQFTEWHNIKAFGKQAEVVQKIVHKGRMVLIVGRAKESRWTDKDGNEKRRPEVFLNTITILDWNKDPKDDDIEDLEDAY